MNCAYLYCWWHMRCVVKFFFLVHTANAILIVMMQLTLHAPHLLLKFVRPTNYMAENGRLCVVMGRQNSTVGCVFNSDVHAFSSVMSCCTW